MIFEWHGGRYQDYLSLVGGGVGGGGLAIGVLFYPPAFFHFFFFLATRCTAQNRPWTGVHVSLHVERREDRPTR